MLAAVNSKLQRTYGVSVTSSQIIRHLIIEEIAVDLRAVLKELNDFAVGLQPLTLGKSVA
jgi:hypothetical protein